MSGSVHSIFLSPAAGAPAVGVTEARALPGRGLEGDRYALGKGSFSRWPGPGREVTFIESEVIEDVLLTFRIDLTAGQSRRNIVTVGMRLPELMRCTFRIGTAVFRGDRPADPCAVLERRIGPGLMEALRSRGGLRASIVREGVIRVGDIIEVISRPMEDPR